MNKIKQILKLILPEIFRETLISIQRNITNYFKNKKLIKNIPELEPLKIINNPKYIISLTSFGDRLSETAPLAILRLFNQTVKPDKIMLWVVREDEKKIGPNIKKLVEKGLEINLCDDIKSFCKLIFTLESYPDDIIITVDDDLYYPENWFEQLQIAHRKNPKKIICSRAHSIRVDENHNLLPYLQWDMNSPLSYNTENPWSLFPSSGWGTLYPPNCFYKDISNKEIFMKLTPRSDEIWFWAMSVINKDYFGEESPFVIINDSSTRNIYGISSKQQKNNNALKNYNWQGGKDLQLNNVINHYPQIKDIFNKIKI